ncbi:barstar family protein [Streptomyces sp. NBC_01294]|uniref:barstar family protein n=1 Tax=Streptomyces sp. NBC_01294 TaxID=2903815 RepID=UPI002DD8563E|nr:barstar family protein [Streptomyces sp. NBC_01294]WRZ60405.1 barstar family protein [Streptomyces sp. NBC_01294]
MSLDPQPLAPALEAAEAAGWTVLGLDLDGVRGKAGLMRRCGGALRLPEWVGGNWDALADALRDLSWLPVAGGGGRLVAVTSWRGYAGARPGEWEILVEILEEAVDFWRGQEGEPPLVVLLAEAGPGPEAEAGPTGLRPGPRASNAGGAEGLGAPPRTPRLKRRRGWIGRRG